jgi:hypothetical protein
MAAETPQTDMSAEMVMLSVLDSILRIYTWNADGKYFAKENFSSKQVVPHIFRRIRQVDNHSYEQDEKAKPNAQ